MNGLNPLESRRQYRRGDANWRLTVITMVVIAFTCVVLVLIANWQVNKNQTKEITNQTQLITCLLRLHIQHEDSVGSCPFPDPSPIPSNSPVQGNSQTVPSTTQGGSVPSGGVSEPQKGSQQPPPPTPKACTVNLLGFCL